MQECISAAKQGSQTPATVMTYVAGLTNFAYPACKNPYAATGTALVAGAATASGTVGMASATLTTIEGLSVPGITVNYVHKAGAGSVDVPVE